MNESNKQFEFSEREQHVLKMLVDHYISDGQPVGSRTLSKLPGVDISAASVRNVMGDLEQMGLLKSPHTSAGRVPTSKGYRVFVDTMLQVQTLSDETIDTLRTALDPSLSPQSLVKIASNCLSGVTAMAGMVSVPKRSEYSLRQIEFLPLSNKRVLAILIVNNQEVQNRIIPVDKDYTKAELENMTQYLNAEYMNKSLSEMRDIMRSELQRAKEDMNQQMEAMIEVAGKVFEPEQEQHEDQEDMVVAGETNLMTHAELSNVDTLKALFDAFSTKRDVFHLLERCVSADGVQIFIGQESGHDILDDCSLITSPYEVEGTVVGVLGVVGPKRMAYDRVIPVVDITSKLLSAALNSQK